jgi:hypothetical protein
MTTSHKQTALSLSTVVSEIVFLNIFFLKYIKIILFIKIYLWHQCIKTVQNKK